MQLGTCFITLKSYIKSMFMSMSLTSNIKLISNVYRSDLESRSIAPVLFQFSVSGFKDLQLKQ